MTKTTEQKVIFSISTVSNSVSTSMAAKKRFGNSIGVKLCNYRRKFIYMLKTSDGIVQTLDADMRSFLYCLVSKFFMCVGASSAFQKA